MEEKEELYELGYRDNVQALFRTKSSSRFLNGSAWHAAYIFEAMLQHAESSVDIFCRNLNESVFSHTFIKRALSNIGNNVKVNILVQSCSDDIEAKDLFDDIRGNNYPRVNVKAIVNTENKKLPYNFAVMDGRAFRFEPTRDTIAAIASANEPETAQMLMSQFQSIQNKEPKVSKNEH